jgi:hypothetical protein
MINKTNFLVFVFFLTSIGAYCQSALDSSGLRVSGMVDANFSAPDKTTPDIPFRLSPEFGFDAYIGTKLRLGLGAHYFLGRPEIYQGTGLGPGNHDRYLLNTRGWDIPVSICATVIGYRGFTINLALSLALGKAKEVNEMGNKYSDYMSELKVGLPIAIAMPNRSYLEFVPYYAGLDVNAETIHTGFKYGLGIRYGFLRW